MRIWWLMALGCGPAAEPEPDGPLQAGTANPFPQASQIDASGQLALAGLPDPGFDTPLPLGELGYRTGFSRGQVAVLRWPGLANAVLPTFDDAETEGAVQIVDLANGDRIPCFAELDAAAESDPSLLVRPLTALPARGRVAIVVTTQVMPRPEAFMVEGEITRPLLDDLEGFGLERDAIAVAWAFPIDDGTAPLRSALSQIRRIGMPSLTEDEAGRTRSLTYRAFTGLFPVVDFVGAEGRLDLQFDGTVVPRGEAEAELFVHVPASVADAPAGSVPLLVFGHGIFSSPEAYLAGPEDDDGVRALADELGAIVVATPWRGLTTSDLSVALGASQDFGQFPRIPNLLVQGQVNVRTLIEGLRDGTFIDDPAFEGQSGQRLPNPDQILYYGISVGGIEGSVLLATDPGFEAAAFHVGGAMWSTMLERSSNWPPLELGLLDQIPEADDRQVLYALTQLWWDPVDPISYAADLAKVPFLYQVSIGDEQVPNFTSEAFARAVGLPMVEPTPKAVVGLDMVSLPLKVPARGLVWFDPERELPVSTNRPAVTTGAHTSPRLWDGARRQVVDYLDPAAPGTLVHHCGAEPCTESNATP
ncbi:MAG: hypothetical protein AAGA48_15470 [Myxococcota bacterium]